MRALLLSLFLCLLPLVCAVPHGDYPSFSSPEGRFSLQDDVLSVADAVIYEDGYVSVGGEEWQPVTLAGEPYGSSADWLAGGASLDLSSFSFPSDKESYVIVYSCSQTSGWDCHATNDQPDGFWQLFVIGEPTLPSGTLYLVEDGVAQADIVISPSAPPSVSLAADYFQFYLEEMSGATLPISNNPDPAYDFHVYIGQSTYTDALGVTDEDCRDGGFRMVTGDDHLVLLGEDDEDKLPGFEGVPGPATIAEWDAYVSDTWGGDYLWDNDFLHFYDKQRNSNHDLRETDKKGSLNAVFEFLQEQGIRWYHPGWHEYPNIGVVIPSKPTIGFQPRDEIVNPDFPMREFMLYSKSYSHLSPYHYDGRADEELRWVLSLRSNAFYEFLVASSGGPAHGIRAVIIRQSETHPEYYAMDSSGQRQLPGVVPYPAPNLCYPYYTEENTLFEENVKYAKTMFDLYDVPIVSIMPNDGLGVISNECADKATPERGTEGRYSDYVWEYVNNVAWEIYNDPEYQGKMVSNSAYTPYRLPPLSLSKEVAPNLAVFVGRSRRSFSDEETKASNDDLLGSWKDVLASNNHLTGGKETNVLFTSDYYLNNRYGSSTQGVPMYAPHFISEDLKSLKGVSSGEFMEVGTTSFWPPYNIKTDEWDVEWDAFAANALNIYVLSRLYWDADQDVDLLLEEYYDLFYGPADEEMRSFIEYSESHSWKALIDPDVVPTMRDLLAHAKEVAGETIYGHRIDLLIGLMDSQFSEQEILIGSCQDLTSPLTTYKLTNDVTSTGTCFNIEQFDITLDCQGHTITYATGGEGKGVRVDRHNSFTIKNCDIRSTSQGINRGIDAYRSTGITIRNTTIVTNSMGMDFEDVEDVLVEGNTVTTTAPTIALYSVNDATITDNHFAAQEGMGLYLYNSYNVTATGNDVTSTTNYASHLLESSGNTFSDNTFTSETTHGQWLYKSPNNTFINNHAASRDRAGVRLSTGADGNLFVGQSASGGTYAIDVENAEENTFQDCGELVGGVRDRGANNEFINCP
ncbi:DUF4838 domain-containing protein [Candidatus Woesearchaeota archaeon]|nr:DUF4838 domain-containing protein [Candidatus Woesearchaeota archaeon]